MAFGRLKDLVEQLKAQRSDEHSAGASSGDRSETTSSGGHDGDSGSNDAASGSGAGGGPVDAGFGGERPEITASFGSEEWHDQVQAQSQWGRGQSAGYSEEDDIFTPTDSMTQVGTIAPGQDRLDTSSVQQYVVGSDSEVSYLFYDRATGNLYTSTDWEDARGDNLYGLVNPTTGELAAGYVSVTDEDEEGNPTFILDDPDFYHTDSAYHDRKYGGEQFFIAWGEAPEDPDAFQAWSENWYASGVREQALSYQYDEERNRFYSPLSGRTLQFGEMGTMTLNQWIAAGRPEGIGGSRIVDESFLEMSDEELRRYSGDSLVLFKHAKQPKNSMEKAIGRDGAKFIGPAITISGAIAAGLMIAASGGTLTPLAVGVAAGAGALGGSLSAYNATDGGSWSQIVGAGVQGGVIGAAGAMVAAGTANLLPGAAPGASTGAHISSGALSGAASSTSQYVTGSLMTGEWGDFEDAATGVVVGAVTGGATGGVFRAESLPFMGGASLGTIGTRGTQAFMRGGFGSFTSLASSYVLSPDMDSSDRIFNAALSGVGTAASTMWGRQPGEVDAFDRKQNPPASYSDPNVSDRNRSMYLRTGDEGYLSDPAYGAANRMESYAEFDERIMSGLLPGGVAPMWQDSRVAATGDWTPVQLADGAGASPTEIAGLGVLSRLQHAASGVYGVADYALVGGLPNFVPGRLNMAGAYADSYGNVSLATSNDPIQFGVGGPNLPRETLQAMSSWYSAANRLRPGSARAFGGLSTASPYVLSGEQQWQASHTQGIPMNQNAINSINQSTGQIDLMWAQQLYGVPGAFAVLGVR